jgi:hypothetical protein
MAKNTTAKPPASQVTVVAGDLIFKYGLDWATRAGVEINKK